MKPILYLDMDGVVADFNKAYLSQWDWGDGYKFDRERFYKSVVEKHIFSDLEWMPNGIAFISGIREIEKEFGLHIEMLTSTGSKRTLVKTHASSQKTQWLIDMGLMWKPNFVTSKPEKAQYATPMSILIDDSEGCIKPFIAAGGFGILHKDENYDHTLNELYNIVSSML